MCHVIDDDRVEMSDVLHVKILKDDMSSVPLQQLLRQKIHEMVKSPLFQSFDEALRTHCDIGIVKDSIIHCNISRHGLDLLIGFYSEKDVTFELYIDNSQYASYTMKAGEFCPIGIHDPVIIPLINFPFIRPEPIPITVVETSSSVAAGLFAVGALLKRETYRKEIQTKQYHSTVLYI